MKPPVPGSIRNLEHRSSWCCHVWTWAKLVLFFFNGIFPENGSKTMDCSISNTVCPHDSTSLMKEGKELHQSHGRPHHYPDSGDVCWKTGPRAPHIQLVTTCKGPVLGGWCCENPLGSCGLLLETGSGPFWGYILQFFFHHSFTKNSFISIATCCGSLGVK